MGDRILLSLCKMGGKEKDFIEAAFRDNWVVPLGPNVDGFEKDLETFLLPEGSRKRVCALASGTAAIHLGLVMLGVERGDEVMVQSLTFSASANPVKYQGATPVFVDSEPETWNIDPQLLDYAIKDRKDKTGRLPKAIVFVDLYGMPAKMREIEEVARKWGIPVLEDAAEAFGSEYQEEKCGNFGEYGVLSFNGNKMITTSGGGALVCPDDEAFRRVMNYATQSREATPWYQHERIGYNYRMSNICAGIGRGQMMVAQEHIDHHRWVQAQYREAFKDFEGIILHENPGPEFDSNFWLPTITFSPEAHISGEEAGGKPEAMRRILEKENIETRHVWKPMHLQPFFKDCPAYLNGVSEDLFNSGLCLPASPWVGQKELEKIISTIKSAFK
ncbi:MAG: aminotransferase class I/II-fold pyridoxal phosphate-dependent enzyme [Muribaculaceae bacterium]|nr:aminotransferase class I/II-fold pyridoxal phosphate-dependent enzyme [Muribaculaceae bacterium]